MEEVKNGQPPKMSKFSIDMIIGVYGFSQENIDILKKKGLVTKRVVILDGLCFTNNHSIWQSFKNVLKLNKIKFKCRLFSHDWTSNVQKGIPPTVEQIDKGVVGFAEYATMYCDRCGHVSELSLKFIQKCKDSELK